LDKKGRFSEVIQFFFLRVTVGKGGPVAIPNPLKRKSFVGGREESGSEKKEAVGGEYKCTAGKELGLASPVRERGGLQGGEGGA